MYICTYIQDLFVFVSFIYILSIFYVLCVIRIRMVKKKVQNNDYQLPNCNHHLHVSDYLHIKLLVNCNDHKQLQEISTIDCVVIDNLESVKC